KIIAEALCVNNTLTSLDLTNNRIGNSFENNEAINVLADALCKIKTLTNLILSNVGLTFEKGQVLAEVLCKNSTLTFLDLSSNRLGYKG
ncbi:6444_t:CDS:2, partial [Cetraspora pellucida]